MGRHRFGIGKWHFCLSFGRFPFKIDKQAKHAGMLCFGFGGLTYIRTK